MPASVRQRRHHLASTVLSDSRQTTVFGRKRRSTLQKKHLEMPLYQRIADEVVELMSGNLLLEEIAEKLDVDRNTVTSAIRWWHEARGLPVPDGRSRLQNLNRKSVPWRAKAG
jgi:hypothetical protein